MVLDDTIDGSVESGDGLGKTKRGTPRKRRPGAGRKKTESTAYKEVYEKLLRAHPETVEIMLNMARGKARVRCPECGHVWEKAIGEGANPVMLQHIDNRVMGKPVQKTEVDLMGHLDLSSAQLTKLAQMVDEFMQQVASVSVSVIEAEFKELPHPDVSDIRQRSVGGQVERMESVVPDKPLPSLVRGLVPEVEFTIDSGEPDGTDGT